jgi:hypothetical protein
MYFALSACCEAIVNDDIPILFKPEGLFILLGLFLPEIPPEIGFDLFINDLYCLFLPKFISI